MIRGILKMPIRRLHERLFSLMEAHQRNYGRFFRVKKSLFTPSEKGARELTRSDVQRALILNEFKTALWCQVKEKERDK